MQQTEFALHIQHHTWRFYIMKRVLENDFLKVTIDDHGAELVSIYDKEKDREVIWQGDPRFWGRHAPVLFPNVGKHYGNHYRIGDKEYASKQHGFAVTQISHVLIPHWIP